jgi:hypothetical protein
LLLPPYTKKETSDKMPQVKEGDIVRIKPGVKLYFNSNSKDNRLSGQAEYGIILSTKYSSVDNECCVACVTDWVRLIKKGEDLSGIPVTHCNPSVLELVAASFLEEH